MFIVTGGAGFIGSNLIKRLNFQNYSDIIVVDNLGDSSKFLNLSGLKISDFINKNDFLNYFKNHDLKNIEAIFHFGACSATTEKNGNYLMKNNYEYSKELLHLSVENNLQFIYASSASVYGLGLNGFQEDFNCEFPINLYAFSKFQFDQYVRKNCKNSKSQVVGLRYFNVYGPRENHKGAMASPMQHFYNQIKSSEELRLFKGYGGYQNGEQSRDFVYVDDCIDVNLFFLRNKSKSGIFNIGSGRSESFNNLAKIIIDWFEKYSNLKPSLKYIDFPDHLKGKYQSYTKADLNNLRSTGYLNEFTSLKDGVSKYFKSLNNQK